MQRDSQQDVINAWQAGSVQAAQMFVRRHQAEIRGIAYLLTLDQNTARGLAHATFEQFFQSIRTIDPDSDPRIALLTRLGRTFLRKEYEAEAPNPVAFMATPLPQKYGVENQRDRVTAALGRMDERERVALVLGEVAGFEPGQLNTVLERGNNALVAPMETGRQRLRQSLDIPAGNPVRPALLDAMFDGPQDDIWPAIEDNVAQIQRNEQRRGQLFTWGIAAGVILILLAGIIALFDLNPFGGDGPAATEIAGELTPEDELAGTPGPTQIPPTPTPTPPPLPAVGLPNLYVGAEFSRQTAGFQKSRVLQYDPETNRIVSLGESEATRMLQNAAYSTISPDGKSLIVLATSEPLSEEMYRVMVFDVENLSLRWDTTVIVDPNRQGFNWLASGSDALYLAQFDETSSLPVITAYAMEDGVVTGSVELDYPTTPGQPAIAHSLNLHIAPDESSLLVTLYRFPWISDTERDDWYALIPLPDLEPVTMLQIEQPEGQPPFDLRRAQMTIDGNALYTFDYGPKGLTLVAQFFRLSDQRQTTVEVPFTQDDERPFTSNVVRSNDGRRLYVYDTTAAEIAIINLSEQRLERFFPLDAGEFASLLGNEPGRFGLGWPSLLSLDGERLYIAARFNSEPDVEPDVEQTGIWVIDVPTWTIVDFWPVAGVIDSLDPVPGSDSLLVRSQEYPPLADPEQTITNVITFARMGRVNGELMVEPITTDFADEIDSFYQFTSLARLYAMSNGRTAGIDGETPADPVIQSSLPGIRVWAPLNVASNQSTRLTVRILDPLTNRPLETGRDDVRFDPDATITARLTLEGSPGQLVVLGMTEPGIYRGNINLPAHGTWNVDVSIINPDGTGRQIPAVGAVTIQPALIGDDGRIYRARLTYEPGDPRVNQRIIIRVRLVDTETGEMIPEGVGISTPQDVLGGASLDPLPERVYVIFGAPGSTTNRQTLILSQAGHGVWQQTMTFWTDGAWSTSVQVPLSGTQQSPTLFTGTVTIDPENP